jgi:hypothetical protein
MVTVSAIAQRILDENNYTTTTANISLTKLEYLIDNAIDYVNLQTGTSITDLAGSAESKTLTGTENEVNVVKTLSSLMLRAYVEKGPNVGIQSISVSVVSTDPHFRLFWQLFLDGLDRLRGKGFERV